MNALARLQRWYRSQCDGEWEHGHGVSIGTLDNPGWTMEVSLQGTDLERREFPERVYGVGHNGHASGEDWLKCKVEANVFKAFGGPSKLEEMIEVFLDWAGTIGEPQHGADPGQPFRSQ